MGRRAFNHRLAFVADSREQAIALLRKPNEIRLRNQVSHPDPRVAMLFPGQSSQYPGMGGDLYRTESFFRQIIDECCERLKSLANLDLLDVLYPQIAADDVDGHEKAARKLEQTRYAQPALFVTSYALARLWMHWGVQPACLAGHSVGEIVAACLAGVFSLDDALLFVARRGEWMQEMSPGSMLAVRMPAEQLQNLLPPAISIAAINSPSLTVVSGPAADIDDLAAQLEKQKIVSRALRTSHAFHSSMVEPVIEPLRHLLAQMTLHQPEIEVVSTVSGLALTAAEATSPEYWARHCRVPVHFSAAAATLLRSGYELYLEVGAGETLTTLVRQQMPKGAPQAGTLASLPAADAYQSGSKRSAWDVLAPSIGAMWTRGVPVDWTRYYASERRRRAALPTYPFERKRYWVEAKETLAMKPQPASSELSNTASEISIPAQSGNLPSIALNSLENKMNTIATPQMASTPSQPAPNGAARIEQGIAALLENLSGLELTPDQYDLSFLELGFDSLFLTQAAQKIQATYGVKIAFRQLLDNLSSIRLVAEHLLQQLPADSIAPPVSITEGVESGRGASTVNISGLARSRYDNSSARAHVPPRGRWSDSCL